MVRHIHITTYQDGKLVRDPPNHLYLCKFTAEALTSGLSLHLQLVASEGETIETNFCGKCTSVALPITS